MLSLFGCNKSIKDASFKSNNIDVYIGSQIIVDYDLTPVDANSDNLQIVSSDENILASIQNNIFEAVSEGTVNLVLTNNEKEYDTCIVNVIPIEVEEIKAVNNQLSLGVGNSVIPEILFYPDNCTYKDYKLISENNQIAKTNNNQIIGVCEGSTEITIIASNNKTDTFTVNVVPVIANSISISSTPTLKIGEQIQLSLLWNPYNVTYKNVKWSTSDNNIASIDANGILTAKKDGNVTVTAVESSNNKEATKTIYINPIEIEDMVVTSKNYEIYEGESTQIYVDIKPNNATNKEVTYESNNTSILKVSNTGYVSAIGVGTAKIIVKTKNGLNKTAEITVKKKPKKTVYVDKVIPSSVNATSSENGSYMLNTNTKKFHRTTCNDINKMKEENKKLFSGTREEVINMGYSPCGHCKP